MLRQIPAELLECYLADPLKADGDVRKRLGIPDGRYYTVSTWPPELAGRVELTGTRMPRAPKISKSSSTPAQ